MPESQRGPVHQDWEDNARHDRTTEQARQGVTFGHMRYVLGISTVLLVVIYAIIYFAGAKSW